MLFICCFPIWDILKLILTIISIIIFIGLIILNVIINYTIAVELDYNILQKIKGGNSDFGGQGIKYQYLDLLNDSIMKEILLLQYIFR